MRALGRLPLLATVTVLAAAPVLAAVANRAPSRFDRLIRLDAGTRIGTIAEAPDALPGFDAERTGWERFRQESGATWSVYVDRRSGAPLLVTGSGLRFVPSGGTASLATMEAKARAFVASHEVLFKVRHEELVLSTEGSGPADSDHWILVFTRRAGGVPVDDERFTMYVTRGNLVAFGADRWGAIDDVPSPAYSVETARGALLTFMGVATSERPEWVDAGTLILGAEPGDAAAEGRYRGAVGSGLTYRLVYRFVLRLPGEPGSWLAKVDAGTGEVVTFDDSAKYAQVKGGVFPVSNDGQCEDGCEQPSFPMPFADVAIGGPPQTANDMGLFDCSPSGGTATTTLAGPYFRVNDNCGPIAESIVCDDDLDLSQGPGTDCAVPPGASPGNTHASRTGFYHLNRIGQKGRSWLPANAWLQTQVVDNVNINATCNAYWNGSVNFYKSGGGCGNTGELAGVFLHEWGHGLDQNDGGGYDNPSEAYADVTAFLQTHASCVGRGFYLGQNCGGYGDTCLSCTGIRDLDWDSRQTHTPATPQGFLTTNCGGGGGPCGKEVHCEGYVSAEAIWDLANRDLTAAGLDAATAWQLTDKLWYKSRQGSGGNAYNCSLPSSDGCGAGSWFTKLRNIDDEDGNLANGTPHAAAIFSAFNRHGIACGTAADASNKNASTCPSLVVPVLNATAGSNSVNLSWSSVPGAANYLILRNDLGCDAGHTIVATVPAPTVSYTDVDLPNGFTLHYAVQAQAANTACESPLSVCRSAAPQPFAGSIKLGQATYACSSTIQITVRDANVGGPTTIATIGSTTEPAQETVTLIETPAGSSKYIGTIAADSGPAVPGNGKISLANGDVITARYTDADDGLGGVNLIRQTSATGDCVFPVVTQVAAGGIDDVRATVTWATDESSTSIVHYGETKPPALVASTAGLQTAHGVPLNQLQACTVYWYSVESQDPAGNVALETNGGQYYHFETLGDLGSGLQSCHSGRITLSKPTVNCGDTLPINLTDLDVNLQPAIADTIVVTVASTTETVPETVTLTETGPNTSQFVGGISTTVGSPSSNGTLEVTDRDLVSVAYQDADDGTGQAAIANASANVDCSGPSATLVEVKSITDESIQIHWVTTEPTTGRIDWGPTAALGSVINAGALTPDHTVTVGPLLECAPYFFRITATDAHGNASVLDANGGPYTFLSSRIPAGVFKDTFETSTGWTLEGDWQIAAPSGKGTPPADPVAAFEGTKVLGQDLTGLGAKPGDYEVSTSYRATSPAINASTLSGGQLRFRRKLSTGDNGSASINVIRNGAIFNVWSTSNAADPTWSLQTLNIAQFADGAASLKIQFAQGSGPTVTHSGWNIDRFIVNSAGQPAFEACGGCGLGPSFAGIVSAKDANPCADGGVTLTWNAAAAWGTGSGGTYVIHRGLSPGFVPQTSNRIATGVGGTTYTDATAPNGVTLYYLVRAENNEACGGGPGNGGAVDTNAVYASAQDQITQILPGGLGSSVRVAGVNDTHVRASWSAIANAAAYHVFRSSSAMGPFTRIAETAGTLYEDRDQFNAANSWYYTVKAADSCGNEGP